MQAPGRVNLIGEHTDYNDGFVLPCAIDAGTVDRRARPRRCRAAARWPPIMAGSRTGSRSTRRSIMRGGWRDYVRGVAAMLRGEGLGRGADLAIAGDVPQGAGLSSSASLEVALARRRWRGSADSTSIRPGSPCSPSRRRTSSSAAPAGSWISSSRRAAEAGHALLIDCRSLDCRPVPMPAGLAVMVIHSGIERGLVDGAYNERRRQCEAAARHYGVAALRDLDEAGAAGRARGARPGRVPPRPPRRQRECPDAGGGRGPGGGDLARLGALMAQSHASMRDDFEITLPAIDRLVEIAAEAIGGEGGARMTGGGFGGCIVALAPAAAVAAFERRSHATIARLKGGRRRSWSAGLRPGPGRLGSFLLGLKHRHSSKL